MRVTVGVEVLHAILGQHPGAVRAAHLADLVPQILVAHHPGQHLAGSAPLHGPDQQVVVHAAVNDERLIHRGRQLLGVGTGRAPLRLCKGTARQQLPQGVQPGLTAMEAHGQLGVVQELLPQGLKFGPHSGPVGLFQQLAQEMIRRHAAHPLGQGVLHGKVCPGADGRRTSYRHRAPR